MEAAEVDPEHAEAEEAVAEEAIEVPEEVVRVTNPEGQNTPLTPQIVVVTATTFTVIKPGIVWPP